MYYGSNSYNSPYSQRSTMPSSYAYSTPSTSSSSSRYSLQPITDATYKRTYSPYTRPIIIDTSKFDLTTPRGKVEKYRSEATYGNIHRGRTVVRLNTKKQQKNKSPGELLIEKFTIKDKKDDDDDEDYRKERQERLAKGGVIKRHTSIGIKVAQLTQEGSEEEKSSDTSRLTVVNNNVGRRKSEEMLKIESDILDSLILEELSSEEIRKAKGRRRSSGALLTLRARSKKLVNRRARSVKDGKHHSKLIPLIEINERYLKSIDRSSSESDTSSACHSEPKNSKIICNSNIENMKTTSETIDKSSKDTIPFLHNSKDENHSSEAIQSDNRVEDQIVIESSKTENKQNIEPIVNITKIKPAKKDINANKIAPNIKLKIKPQNNFNVVKTDISDTNSSQSNKQSIEMVAETKSDIKLKPSGPEKILANEKINNIVKKPIAEAKKIVIPKKENKLMNSQVETQLNIVTGKSNEISPEGTLGTSNSETESSNVTQEIITPIDSSTNKVKFGEKSKFPTTLKNKALDTVESNDSKSKLETKSPNKSRTVSPENRWNNVTSPISNKEETPTLTVTITKNKVYAAPQNLENSQIKNVNKTKLDTPSPDKSRTVSPDKLTTGRWNKVNTSVSSKEGTPSFVDNGEKVSNVPKVGNSQSNILKSESETEGLNTNGTVSPDKSKLGRWNKPNTPLSSKEGTPNSIENVKIDKDLKSGLSKNLLQSTMEQSNPIKSRTQSPDVNIVKNLNTPSPSKEIGINTTEDVKKINLALKKENAQNEIVMAKLDTPSPNKSRTVSPDKNIAERWNKANTPTSKEGTPQPKEKIENVNVSQNLENKKVLTKPNLADKNKILSTEKNNIGKENKIVITKKLNTNKPEKEIKTENSVVDENKLVEKDLKTENNSEKNKDTVDNKTKESKELEGKGTLKDLTNDVSYKPAADVKTKELQSLNETLKKPVIKPKVKKVIHKNVKSPPAKSPEKTLKKIVKKVSKEVKNDNNVPVTTVKKNDSKVKKKRSSKLFNQSQKALDNHKVSSSEEETTDKSISSKQNTVRKVPSKKVSVIESKKSLKPKKSTIKKNSTEKTTEKSETAKEEISNPNEEKPTEEKSTEEESSSEEESSEEEETSSEEDESSSEEESSSSCSCSCSCGVPSGQDDGGSFRTSTSSNDSGISSNPSRAAACKQGTNETI